MDVRDRICRYIDENAGVFTGAADYIWAHPELSLQEFEAAKLYTSLLREHGFTVTEKLGGIDTAFCGSFVRLHRAKSLRPFGQAYHVICTRGLSLVTSFWR